MKSIKKILPLFILSLSLPLILISCSKEENNENYLIMGLWKYDSVVAGEIITNSDENTEKIEPVVISTGENDFEGFQYFFRPDGKLEESSYTDPDIETILGTYSYNNGILTAEGYGKPVTIKATVDSENRLLFFEQEYTRFCNELKKDDLIDLGIDDPDFKVTKAIALIVFSKQ